MAGAGDAIQTQLRKLRRGCARLIDAYSDGLIEKADLEHRLSHLHERIQHLEQDARHLRDVQQEEQELRLLVGRFDLFAQQV